MSSFPLTLVPHPYTLVHMTSKASPTQRALSVWGFILGVWALYRTTIGKDMPLGFDEFVFKPLLFLTPIYYFITHYEHKSLVHGLWIKLHHWRQDMQQALLISLPFLLAGLFMISQSNFSIAEWPWLIAMAAVIAVTEETLSRGFVTSRLYEEGHHWMQILIKASALHLLLRIPRIMTTPQFFGDKLLWVIAAEALVSLIMTGLFLWRKSLLQVIMVRFIYTIVLLALLV